MGITVYSLLWVMQDLYHQPYFKVFGPKDPIMYGFWAILMLRVSIYTQTVHIGIRSRKTILFGFRGPNSIMYIYIYIIYIYIYIYIYLFIY